jgi:TolA-binding protein
MLLIKAKRYDEARRRLEPEVQQHPDSHVALFYLALTYHKQQRYAEARTLYDRVALLQPGYKDVLMFHGWCLYYLGEPAAAQAKFLAFLETRPDYADAHFALGLIAFDDDRMEEARTRLQQAIDSGQAGHGVQGQSPPGRRPDAPGGTAGGQAGVRALGGTESGQLRSVFQTVARPAAPGRRRRRGPRPPAAR